MKILGASFGNKTEAKGNSILDSLESIYELSCQTHLNLPYDDKKNIYAVLIWASREFSALRQKDIFDISFLMPGYVAFTFKLLGEYEEMN